MNTPKARSWHRAFGGLLARAFGRPSGAAGRPETPRQVPSSPQDTAERRVPHRRVIPQAVLEAEQQRREAAQAAARAVPLRVDALREALTSRPALRNRHGHLALLEFACSTNSEDPFSHLPPRTLDVAKQQLEEAARHSPTLDVLRLQLDRHLQERRSQVEAVLAAGDAALAALGARARESTDAPTPWRDTVFMDTVPMELDSRPQWSPSVA